jgi:hypothetical protein
MFRNCSAQILSAQPARLLLLAFACLTFLLAPAWAQQSATVPNLVKFSGAIPTTSGSSVSVVFALYANQSGGAPLWQEVQSLAVDSNGRYTALLGAATTGGVPVDLFSTNEARWLGVDAQGAGEQPRVLLVSVPYALKAADSETLGGLPASAYALAGSVNNTSTASSAASTTTTDYVNTGAVTSAARQAVAAAISITTTATAGTLPVFTDGSGDLGNSLVSQVSTATGGAGNFVGINTASPVANLHILGVNPTMRIEQYGPVGSGDSPNFNFYSGNGTSAAPTATQDGDNLGQFAASGWNGTGFPAKSKVKVSFVAVGAWTPSSMGTAMTFATTSSTDTTATRTERMRIADNGFVGIGTTTPSAVLSVNGDVAMTGGSVGIGTTSPGAPLEVYGNVKLSEGSGGQIIFPDGSTLGSANPLTAASIETTGGTTGTGSVTTNTVNTATLNATTLSAASLQTTGGTGGTGTVSTDVLNADEINVTLGVDAASITVEAATVDGNLEVAGNVVVDSTGSNDGTHLSPGLVFGSANPPAVGIASTQSAGGTNAGGMDFVANNLVFMQIQKSGEVGIGLPEGQTANSVLEVDRSTSESAYPVTIFGENLPLSNVAANYLADPTNSNLSVGVWGDGGQGDDGSDDSPDFLGIGVIGSGDFAGGEFFSDGIGPALEAQYTGTAGFGEVFLAMGTPASGGGYDECDVDDSGNLGCTGTVEGSVPIISLGSGATTGSAAARRVAVYAVESPENWFEDFGSATLSNGVATVALDATFAQTVNTGVEYHVFLTPNGESEGLYVAQKSASSFEVREAHGGRSNISFDYRIVAKRAGYEKLRMPDVTEKFMKLSKMGITRTAKPLPPSVAAKMNPARTRRVMQISPAKTKRGPVAAPQVSPAPKSTLK